MINPWSRNFSSSSKVFAAVPKFLGGKSKAKQGFKGKREGQSEKVKKSGMTALNFKDAVRSMGFEKFAPPLDIKPLEKEFVEGEVYKYGSKLDTLERLNGFKKYQHHEAFSQPITLISKNLSNFIETFEKSPCYYNKKIIIRGEHRIGKSTLMTQYQAVCPENTLFFHFDDINDLRDGSSDFLFNKKLGLYQQPMFTRRFIKSFTKANAAMLKGLKLKNDIKFISNKIHYNYKKNVNTLYDFLKNCDDFDKQEPSYAFQFFINEIKGNKCRKLITIDNFNAITVNPLTNYKSTEFEPIHFQDLEIGRFITQLIDGSLKLNKTNIILCESSNYGKSKNLEIGLRTEDYTPYDLKKLDSRIIDTLLKGRITTFNVENLTKDETTKLIEVYHKAGVLHIRDYMYKQKLVTQTETGVDLTQLAESNFVKSGGNPGLLFRHVALNY